MIPEVSVLLPFHRMDKFLQKAIDSVESNSSVKIQLILIDDRKEKTNDEFTKRSMIWTGGVGYGEALNMAKGLISADYVALMNSDDIVDKKRFDLQIKSLREFDACISVSRLRKIDRHGFPLFSVGGNSRILEPNSRFFLFGSHLANASWLTSRLLWDSNVTFRKWQIGSDWFLGKQLIEHHQFHYMNEPLYSYRVHVSQITKNKIVNEEVISEVWSKLNYECGLPPIPKLFGISMAFPGHLDQVNLQVKDDEIELFEDWIEKVYSWEQPDLQRIAKPRIAYLSYLIWRRNHDSKILFPLMSEFAKIYAQQLSNRMVLKIGKHKQ